MAEEIKCPQCNQIFSDMESYKNHTCGSTSVGGEEDLQKFGEAETGGGVGGQD